NGKTFQRSKDRPATFRQEGHHYVSNNFPDMKSAIDLRLFPAGKDYLFAATVVGQAGGTFYGFLHDDDGVVLIDLAPDEQSSAALSKDAADPAEAAVIAGMKVDATTGAITVDSQAQLDELTKLYVGGKLSMGEPGVGFIGATSDEKPPMRITHGADGSWT